MLKAINFLASNDISNKQTIILSVSGGLDSMALLHLLKSYNYKVVVVHFNHQTRENNLKESLLVKELSDDYNYPFHLFDLDIKGGNFQATARELRYEHLRNIAKKYKTKYIATAHHLDDLAETVLMKITRGSNLYGYAGIHGIYEEKGFVYLKPLLSYSKKELKEYVLNNDVKYLEDESNYLDYYMRNRIRNTVIPILKQENANFLNKIYDYHSILKNSFDFIRKYANNYIVDNKVNLSTFLEQDLIIQDEILVVLLEPLNINLSQNLLNDLRSLINSPRPNLSYDLSNNYLFIKSYDNLFVKEKIVNTNFRVTLDKEINTLPNMKNVTFLSDNKAIPKKSVKICYNKLSLPLIARTREDGDTIKFTYGSKKLKDFFIDKKVPKHLRDELIIITDNENNIIYVENYYINESLGKEKKLLFIIN